MIQSIWFSLTKNKAWHRRSRLLCVFQSSCIKTLGFPINSNTEILCIRMSKCVLVPTSLPARPMRSHHDLGPSRKAGCFWWSSGLNLGPSILSICHLTPDDLNTHYRRHLCVCVHAHVYLRRQVINSRNVHRHFNLLKIEENLLDVTTYLPSFWQFEK